jgi:predicted RNA-binding Zn ribbon-like protein
MVTNFKFIGGALCLDFVNTVGGRENGEVLRDKIHGARDLKRWAGLAHIAAEPVSLKIYGRAIELRESLQRIFESVVNERTPSARDMGLLNREISAMRSREKMIYSRGTMRIAREEMPVITAVVASAVELLMSADLSRLRQCGDHQCGWFFLDTSRNRSRQWCDMRVCGNRAKARRFREQRKPR